MSTVHDLFVLGPDESPDAARLAERVLAHERRAERYIRAAYEANAETVEAHADALLGLVEDDPGLRVRVLRHRRAAADQARQRFAGNAKQARTVAQKLLALIDALGADPSEEQLRLVTGAVGYFEREDDLQADLDAPFGLDDDERVVDAVTHLLRAA